MINEVENNNSLTQMSDLEHDKNQLEMMRYRENRLSYMLGFVALIASILACFITHYTTLLTSPSPLSSSDYHWDGRRSGASRYLSEEGFDVR